MTGIIDVGGGLRGIYGAGVLDRCMDDGIGFDLCIGVSAGSANMAAFLGGQKGRNYRFYTEYARREEYMSAKEFLRNGSYINLDYIYGTLSNEDGDDPLDYAAMQSNPGRLIAVACDAETGEPVYFTKADLRLNFYRVFNASCAIPLACKPQAVGDRLCYDGGVSDPVPVRKAMEEGCDRIVLILTKPLSFQGDSPADLLGAKMLESTFPATAERLRSRGRMYREGVALAQTLAEDGKCLILAPRQTFGVKTVTRDPKRLDALYRSGYEDGGAIRDYLNG